jgi:tRNA(Ile)-lysidine synthetase-like protein
VHALTEQLLKAIRKHGLIRAGDRVAVAVSGGADSVALLSLLLELRAELGIVLSVAHVNHKLRGEESDEDERFVADLAQQHGLELHSCAAPIGDRDISELDSKTSSEIKPDTTSGIEAAARELRYGFFRQLARESRVSEGRVFEGRVLKIATAHTLDDQAETVLLRIFRGTGVRGLAGIHPRIVFEEQGHTFGELLRPLLGFRRTALQEFLRERGQIWREDSSNRDVTFLRNRVRHRLLPIIGAEFGDTSIEHMSELAEIARAEEEHWRSGHPEIARALFPGTESGAEQVVDNVGLISDHRVSNTADNVGLASDHRFAHTADNRSLVSGYRFSDTAESAKSPAPLGAEVPGAEVRPKTRQAASLPLGPLLALPLAAQRRLLRAWLESNASALGISFRLIEGALELARGTTGRKLELPGSRDFPRRNLRRGRQELLLESEPMSEKTSAKMSAETRYAPPADYEYTLTVPGKIEVLELGVSIEASLVDASEVPEPERGQLLDVARMPGRVLIRNWRAGDRYWAAHTAAARKVKDLLSARHATGAQKKLWPVAVAAGSELVWMRGFAAPAAFRPPAGTARAIWIREIAGMM